MTLEDLIRRAAGKQLNGLTLWPSDERWQASVHYKGAKGWIVVIDACPVAALKTALGEKAEEPAALDNIFD